MGGRANGGGGSVRLYTCRYTVTTGMTSALRWAAMRAILMFRYCEGQSHKKRKESRSRFEPRSFCLSALSPFLIGRMFLREPSWKHSSKLYSGP